MKVAVYSGSFNPLHIGHLAIMRYLTAHAGFGRVELVVSPKNPLKEGIDAQSGPERFLAAGIALARHPELKVHLSDIELGMEPPHYTVRTLDALSAMMPSDSLTLAIGADQLADFRRWRDYGRILLDYGIVVFPRSGIDCHALRASLKKENPRYKVRILKAVEVDVSSTQIREALASGQDPFKLLM